MSNIIYSWDKMRVHCRPLKTQKAGWKQVTDERVLAIYRKAVNRCVELGWLEKAEYAPPLWQSNRLVRALGTCYQKRIQYGYYAKDGIQTCEALIVVTSDISKWPDKVAASTLCHELAHAMCVFGEKHSFEWQYRADRIAEIFPDVRVSRLATTEEVKVINSLRPPEKRSQYRYQLICPKCGRTFTKYKSMCESLRRPRWRCGVCHVNLGYKILATDEFKEIR